MERKKKQPVQLIANPEQSFALIAPAPEPESKRKVVPRAVSTETIYQIDGPATINFSGGRTSGYMLYRCLEAGLSQDVYITFADTGLEREETYEFIQNIEKHWGVKVEWLRRPAPDGMTPFEALIRERKSLPNPIQRFCTEELKIRTIAAFMKAKGFTEWSTVLGIRADEPRRVHKILARAEGNHKDTRDVLLPLWRDGVTKDTVMAFWARQPFDLQLKPYEGNCDACFLKGAKKKQRIFRDHPKLADWWIRMETLFVESAGRAAKFRAHGLNYAQLLARVQNQPEFDFGDPEESDVDDLSDCLCGD